jgi:hypothetical protein
VIWFVQALAIVLGLNAVLHPELGPVLWAVAAFALLLGASANEDKENGK